MTSASLCLGLMSLLVAWSLAPALSQPADGATTITITDRVLVQDSIRLGINLGGDAYYSGAALVKKRATANFEGTSYRQCHFGPLQDETGAATWFKVPDAWREVLIGGKYTILSGPAKGTSGTIVDITTKKLQHEGQLKDFSYFVFDKKVAAGPPNGGLLVERMRLDEGQLRPLDGYWNSEENGIAIGDVPPGSFGNAAAVLNGTQGKAHLRFSTHYQRYGETNGRWNVHFWAKARSGAPELRVGCDRGEFGESAAVELSTEWQKFELAPAADGVPEPKDAKENAHLLFVFEATGGEVLLDDVEIWMDGDTNPTAFRDDCVEALKTFRPGVLRYLQMGGNTVENCLRPPLRAHSFTSRRSHKPGALERHNKTPYSLHEMYELCEHIGCEPWYSLPGTLNIEEIRNFTEYLAGPTDTRFGKMRADLGHPKPWTHVFARIHVEFGNEAWNNAGPYQVGGFNGPDYWHDLIAAGKASPHYKPSIVFHAAGQASYSGRNAGIIKNAPNADRFGVAPYIIQSLSDEQLTTLDTDEKLFRWALAWPIWRATNPDGAMYQNDEIMKQAGVEMSVYEVNHHITHGEGALERRNDITTSIGGGLNVANTMLQMLKDYGLRTQALFSLAQHSYNARAIGPVRLWGTVLNMRNGHERYRPTFLACALANRVIRGDLVETVHEGADPTFSATGIFSRRRGMETLEDLPCLHTYAFSEGNSRGLIVVNLDVTNSNDVVLRFEGDAVGGRAQSWLLTADRITANNEFESPEPQVTITQAEVADFASGRRLTIRPFSMLGLVWEVEA